ncbi:MAG: prepilin peptidase [Candidatus Eremiobacteraeota bacterium]|nr:prepilin peptidase [Candidatus Eremiobacteraeota bacterium]MBV8367118.1 prepilin peptidase [Candidatus Eremiobacteraeota bacterium]
MGARCRYCGRQISARYPLVEALTAAVFVVAAAEFNWTFAFAAACILGMVLVTIAFIDLEHLLVLDVTTITGAVLGVALALAMHRIVDALEGAACAGAILGAIYLLTRGAGMGLGDVKLAAMIGLFIGYPLALWTTAASFIIGALLIVPVLATRSRGRRDALPFGPFLVIAALLATFAPLVLAAPYDAYRALFNG